MLGETTYLRTSLLFFRVGTDFLDEQVPLFGSITGRFFSYLLFFEGILY